ncbi:PaaI family thioesterase [uncultured Neptuniibacter sp.]|uniref:PaaI family thioesterase n=1 Tax=uncultured Neptuniibacter sp. TaxID=502143 RepID=UPI002620B4BF|nr:PaaI family thioesterase [uncultured Neptuniibacter sp.]
MRPNNPDYELETRRVFDQAPFIRMLGAELIEFGPGSCRTRIILNENHKQQDGFVHAGVQATLADHSCGTAAATLIAQGQRVLTADFTVNLLRPAEGMILECEARVIKQGNLLTVAEGEVYIVGKSRKLVAKATVTLAVVSVE